MPSKKDVVLGILDEKNYALVDGVKYPVKFVGRDANTYEHMGGCLAKNNPNGACQCDALGRTASIYGVYVPGKALDGTKLISKEPFS